MFEVTISVPKNSEYLLAQIEKKSELVLQQIDGIGSDVYDNGRRYYSLACSDTFRFQLQRFVVQCVSETMSSAYKNEFMRKCLGVKHGTFMQNVLINTMCVFDKSADQQSVSKLLNVEKQMCLDGYCNFRLGQLKKKWKEIASLVSENNFILHDEQLILEFLQYLLESVDSKCSQLSVSLDNDQLLLYDGGRVLPIIESMAKESTLEENAALNVLLLKPRTVTVYHTNKLSDEFCKVLKLFDCKFVQTQ